MILPAKWQETLTFSQSRVIGDTDSKGQSTFRRSSNKEVLQTARLDLAYGWNPYYQSGVSLRYQNRDRELNGSESGSSGWSDVGLSQAYQPKLVNRLWLFHTLNVPTAESVYTSQSSTAAFGTGTYVTSVGVFGIENRKEWDFIWSSEVHRSFARTFHQNGTDTEVGGFWGGSFTLGAGYIPWRSKARLGASLTPRYEGAKDVAIDGQMNRGKESVVWDTSINFTYTFNAEYALGASYVDQTIFGPARNTLLNRSISFLFQSRWL
jgi:hypothetical protein